MKLSFCILLCFTALLMSACDPRFKTTTEICSTNQNEVVIVSLLNYKVKSGDDEYQPYLQDMLTALQTTPGTSEEQAALDKTLAIINNFMPYEIIDNKVETANAIDIIESLIATTNPEIVIEAFKIAKQQLAAGISADDGFCVYTNRNITINNYVTINEGTDQEEDILESQLFAELRLTYDPFNHFFSQNIILTESQEDFNDTTKRTETPFIGFYETAPEDFKSVGFSPATVRFATLNNTELTEVFTFDDDFIDQIGTIEFETADTFCTLKNSEGDEVVAGTETIVIEGDTNTYITESASLVIEDNLLKIDGNTLVINDVDVFIDTVSMMVDDTRDSLTINSDAFTISATAGTAVINGNTLVIDGNSAYIAESTLSDNVVVIECAPGVLTRTPTVVKDQCDGGLDTEGNLQRDETRRLEIRPFDLNAENTNLKRLRIETDYKANTISIFGSRYKEAIFDSDGIAVIEDPTNCEKQAVLDELAELTPGEGVRLTAVPDPNYDFVFQVDENGNTVVDDSGAGIIDETKLPVALYIFDGTTIPARQ